MTDCVLAISSLFVCLLFLAEDVPQYQLPFEDLAGSRPSLDTMKDIVVSNKLRPSLPSIWANDEVRGVCVHVCACITIFLLKYIIIILTLEFHPIFSSK